MCTPLVRGTFFFFYYHQGSLHSSSSHLKVWYFYCHFLSANKVSIWETESSFLAFSWRINKGKRQQTTVYHVTFLLLPKCRRYIFYLPFSSCCSVYDDWSQIVPRNRHTKNTKKIFRGIATTRQTTFISPFVTVLRSESKGMQPASKIKKGETQARVISKIW